MMVFLPCRLWVTGFIFFSAIFPVARAADTNPPPRLTVELRDGSRVVGTSAEKNFKFRSTFLGKIKLDVKNIRSVECVATNLAKLTTASGDSLTVSFVDSSFAVKTSFGKVDLQVDSVRKISMSVSRATATHPPGLVALWSGEGDGNDAVGGNNMTLTDVSFADGQVGQAFSLNGTRSSFKIPDSPTLNVGEGEGFTITAWIKPSDVGGFHPILEWNNGNGVQIWIGQRPDNQGLLFANVIGVDGDHHRLASASGIVVAGRFQQAAVTYDKASGRGVLYLNGTIVAQSQWDNFVPMTKGGLLSYRPSNPGDWTYNRFFAGLLDEVSIYNRALSAAEIRADYDEAGKSN